MTRIVWVNHASYVLESGGVALLADPWLEGTAFNDGWSLLSETKLRYEDFAGITHLWFSHEHPDHFAPRCVMRIPEALRRKIAVLYQKTPDGKIAAFCRKAGFPTTEMEPGRPYELAPGFAVLCAPFTGGDSWLHARTPDRTILNVNDCVIRTEEDARRVRDAYGGGPLDALLTQFSYANWVGNPPEAARRRAEAREKLDRVLAQLRVFEPRWTIPFASFVEFTHAENSFMNDGANRAEDALRAIREEGGREGVVLYPGDVWEIGGPAPTESALARYAEDYARLGLRPRTRARPVSEEELSAGAERFRRTIFGLNNGPLLRLLDRAGYFGGTTVYLWDLKLAVRFSIARGLERSDASREACDLAMGAESLLYCFDNLWGAGTLAVNGRFEEARPGGRARFWRNFAVAAHNNQGLRFPRDFLSAEAAISRLRKALGR